MRKVMMMIMIQKPNKIICSKILIPKLILSTLKMKWTNALSNGSPRCNLPLITCTRSETTTQETTSTKAMPKSMNH